MAKAARGRNLFAIDQAAIESTLGEANQPLLKRRDTLLAWFRNIPDTLRSIEDIEMAQQFAEEVLALQGESRRARLDDGRSFTEASRTVKGFFDRIDGPLRATMDELTERVTEAAKRQRREAAERARLEQEAIRRAGPTVLQLPLPPAPAPVAVIKDPSGGSVATIRPDSGSGEIPLEWFVHGFDRQTIDLEQLRPFLTEAAIIAACEKHLKANGPNRLAGVVYEQQATTR